MKPDASVTRETVCTETATLGTSLVVSDEVEESEKVILLKEPDVASSEITAQSKLTPTRSGLGSERSLQATSEGKLQTSLEGPPQIFETLQGSSESKEDAQDSAMASTELEGKEDSHDDGSVQARFVNTMKKLRKKIQEKM